MDDSIYRLRHQDLLALCVLALLCLGAVMVQSASMHVTGEAGWQWTQRGQRHLIYAAVAAFAFFALGHVDYRRLLPEVAAWRNPTLWILALAILLCTIVLVPGIGVEVNGARRWLRLGDIQFQPSELAKWATVLFLAWWLTCRPLNLGRFFTGFIPTLVPIGIVCLLVVLHDFGTAALIGLCGLALLVVGRIRLWHLAMVIPPAIAAAGWFVVSRDYRLRRMTAFLDPYAAPQAEGYHMIQSLLSFSSGGLAGRGLGNGVQKLGYLPEDTTDFIFAVICEELGFFGAALTVALYLGILYVAWQVIRPRRDDGDDSGLSGGAAEAQSAQQPSDPGASRPWRDRATRAEAFGRMLAFGIVAMLGLQATINIAVATVSVPTKGLSLPLVSAGGSGLVITCAALGLLYSVMRIEAKHQPEGNPMSHTLNREP